MCNDVMCLASPSSQSHTGLSKNSGVTSISNSPSIPLSSDSSTTRPVLIKSGSTKRSKTFQRSQNQGRADRRRSNIPFQVVLLPGVSLSSNNSTQLTENGTKSLNSSSNFHITPTVYIRDFSNRGPLCYCSNLESESTDKYTSSNSRGDRQDKKNCSCGCCSRDFLKIFDNVFNFIEAKATEKLQDCLESIANLRVCYSNAANQSSSANVKSSSDWLRKPHELRFKRTKRNHVVCRICHNKINPGQNKQQFEHPERPIQRDTHIPKAFTEKLESSKPHDHTFGSHGNDSIRPKMAEHFMQSHDGKLLRRKLSPAKITKSTTQQTDESLIDPKPPPDEDSLYDVAYDFADKYNYGFVRFQNIRDAPEWNLRYQQRRAALMKHKGRAWEVMGAASDRPRLHPDPYSWDRKLPVCEHHCGNQSLKMGRLFCARDFRVRRQIISQLMLHGTEEKSAAEPVEARSRKGSPIRLRRDSPGRWQALREKRRLQEADRYVAMEFEKMLKEGRSASAPAFSFRAREQERENSIISSAPLIEYCKLLEEKWNRISEANIRELEKTAEAQEYGIMSGEGPGMMHPTHRESSFVSRKREKMRFRSLSKVGRKSDRRHRKCRTTRVSNKTSQRRECDTEEQGSDSEHSEGSPVSMKGLTEGQPVEDEGGAQSSRQAEVKLDQLGEVGQQTGEKDQLQTGMQVKVMTAAQSGEELEMQPEILSDVVEVVQVGIPKEQDPKLVGAQCQTDLVGTDEARASLRLTSAESAVKVKSHLANKINKSLSSTIFREQTLKPQLLPMSGTKPKLGVSKIECVHIYNDQPDAEDFKMDDEKEKTLVEGASNDVIPVRDRKMHCTRNQRYERAIDRTHAVKFQLSKTGILDEFTTARCQNSKSQETFYHGKLSRSKSGQGRFQPFSSSTMRQKQSVRATSHLINEDSACGDDRSVTATDKHFAYSDTDQQSSVCDSDDVCACSDDFFSKVKDEGVNQASLFPAHLEKARRRSPPRRKHSFATSPRRTIDEVKVSHIPPVLCRDEEASDEGNCNNNSLPNSGSPTNSGDGLSDTMKSPEPSGSKKNRVRFPSLNNKKESKSTCKVTTWLNNNASFPAVPIARESRIRSRLYQLDPVRERSATSKSWGDAARKLVKDSRAHSSPDLKTESKTERLRSNSSSDQQKDTSPDLLSDANGATRPRLPPLSGNNKTKVHDSRESLSEITFISDSQHKEHPAKPQLEKIQSLKRRKKKSVFTTMSSITTVSTNGFIHIPLPMNSRKSPTLSKRRQCDEETRLTLECLDTNQDDTDATQSFEDFSLAEHNVSEMTPLYSDQACAGKRHRYSNAQVAKQDTGFRENDKSAKKHLVSKNEFLENQAEEKTSKSFVKTNLKCSASYTVDNRKSSPKFVESRENKNNNALGSEPTCNMEDVNSPDRTTSKRNRENHRSKCSLYTFRLGGEKKTAQPNNNAKRHSQHGYESTSTKNSKTSIWDRTQALEREIYKLAMEKFKPRDSKLRKRARTLSFEGRIHRALPNRNTSHIHKTFIDDGMRLSYQARRPPNHTGSTRAFGNSIVRTKNKKCYKDISPGICVRPQQGNRTVADTSTSDEPPKQEEESGASQRAQAPRIKVRDLTQIRHPGFVPDLSKASGEHSLGFPLETKELVQNVFGQQTQTNPMEAQDLTDNSENERALDRNLIQTFPFDQHKSFADSNLPRLTFSQNKDWRECGFQMREDSSGPDVEMEEDPQTPPLNQPSLNSSESNSYTADTHSSGILRRLERKLQNSHDDLSQRLQDVYYNLTSYIDRLKSTLVVQIGQQSKEDSNKGQIEYIEQKQPKSGQARTELEHRQSNIEQQSKQAYTEQELRQAYIQQQESRQADGQQESNEEADSPSRRIPRSTSIHLDTSETKLNQPSYGFPFNPYLHKAMRAWSSSYQNDAKQRDQDKKEEENDEAQHELTDDEDEVSSDTATETKTSTTEYMEPGLNHTRSWSRSEFNNSSDTELSAPTKKRYLEQRRKSVLVSPSSHDKKRFCLRTSGLQLEPGNKKRNSWYKRTEHSRSCRRRNVAQNLVCNLCLPSAQQTQTRNPQNMPMYFRYNYRQPQSKQGQNKFRRNKSEAKRNCQTSTKKKKKKVRFRLPRRRKRQSRSKAQRSRKVSRKNRSRNARTGFRHNANSKIKMDYLEPPDILHPHMLLRRSGHVSKQCPGKRSTLYRLTKKGYMSLCNVLKKKHALLQRKLQSIGVSLPSDDELAISDSDIDVMVRRFRALIRNCSRKRLSRMRRILLSRRLAPSSNEMTGQSCSSPARRVPVPTPSSPDDPLNSSSENQSPNNATRHFSLLNDRHVRDVPCRSQPKPKGLSCLHKSSIRQPCFPQRTMNNRRPEHKQRRRPCFYFFNIAQQEEPENQTTQQRDFDIPPFEPSIATRHVDSRVLLRKKKNQSENAAVGLFDHAVLRQHFMFRPVVVNNEQKLCQLGATSSTASYQVSRHDLHSHSSFSKSHSDSGSQPSMSGGEDTQVLRMPDDSKEVGKEHGVKLLSNKARFQIICTNPKILKNEASVERDHIHSSHKDGALPRHHSEYDNIGETSNVSSVSQVTEGFCLRLSAKSSNDAHRMSQDESTVSLAEHIEMEHHQWQNSELQRSQKLQERTDKRLAETQVSLKHKKTPKVSVETFPIKIDPLNSELNEAPLPTLRGLWGGCNKKCKVTSTNEKLSPCYDSPMKTSMNVEENSVKLKSEFKANVTKVDVPKVKPSQFPPPVKSNLMVNNANTKIQTSKAISDSNKRGISDLWKGFSTHTSNDKRPKKSSLAYDMGEDSEKHKRGSSKMFSVAESAVNLENDCEQSNGISSNGTVPFKDLGNSTNVELKEDAGNTTEASASQKTIASTHTNHNSNFFDNRQCLITIVKQSSFHSSFKDTNHVVSPCSSVEEKWQKPKDHSRASINAKSPLKTSSNQHLNQTDCGSITNKSNAMENDENRNIVENVSDITKMNISPTSVVGAVLAQDIPNKENDVGKDIINTESEIKTNRNPTLVLRYIPRNQSLEVSKCTHSTNPDPGVGYSKESSSDKAGSNVGASFKEVVDSSHGIRDSPFVSYTTQNASQLPRDPFADIMTQSADKKAEEKIGSNLFCQRSPDISQEMSETLRHHIPGKQESTTEEGNHLKAIASAPSSVKPMLGTNTQQNDKLKETSISEWSDDDTSTTTKLLDENGNPKDGTGEGVVSGTINLNLISTISMTTRAPVSIRTHHNTRPSPKVDSLSKSAFKVLLTDKWRRVQPYLIVNPPGISTTWTSFVPSSTTSGSPLEQRPIFAFGKSSNPTNGNGNSATSITLYDPRTLNRREPGYDDSRQSPKKHSEDNSPENSSDVEVIPQTGENRDSVTASPEPDASIKTPSHSSVGTNNNALFSSTTGHATEQCSSSTSSRLDFSYQSRALPKGTSSPITALPSTSEARKGYQHIKTTQPYVSFPSQYPYQAFPLTCITCQDTAQVLTERCEENLLSCPVISAQAPNNQTKYHRTEIENAQNTEFWNHPDTSKCTETWSLLKRKRKKKLSLSENSEPPRKLPRRSWSSTGVAKQRPPCPRERRQLKYLLWQRRREQRLSMTTVDVHDMKAELNRNLCMKQDYVTSATDCDCDADDEASS